MHPRQSSRRELAFGAVLAVLFGAALLPLSAHASSFIYPGILDQNAAGAGQTVSRGSSAFFYNPANAIYGKFVETDLDVSYAMISYNYQHPSTDKYDPVAVNLNSPLATAGFSVRPVPSFALGLAVLPLGSGQVQQIQSVPIGIQGAFQQMDIQQKSTAFKVAAGAAFRVADAFTVGAGAIYTSENTQIQLTPSGGGAVFLAAAYAGTCTQIIGGVRSELFDRALVLGLSYRTAGVKKYTGTFSISLPSDGSLDTFTGVGYEPAAIGAGIEGRIGVFGVFAELLREQWSAGTAIANNGLDPSSTGVNYVDVNNITVGAKVWIAPKHMLEAAYGIAGADVGDGTPATTGGAPAGTPNLTGVTFGALDAIPRTIIAGGYRYKLSGTGYLAAGGQYQTGARAVDVAYAQPGTYTLRVISLNLGVGFGF